MAEKQGNRRPILGTDNHAFVLRIWREDGAPRATWRGRITHVGSGTRHSVLRLDEIDLFIAGYLDQMGTRLPLLWRIRRWFAMHKW